MRSSPWCSSSAGCWDCFGGASTNRSSFPNPQARFGVGRTTYAAIPGKSLALVVWYPIDKRAGATPAPYNPTIAGRLLDAQPDPMEENLASIHGNAVADAPVSAAQPTLSGWNFD